MLSSARCHKCLSRFTNLLKPAPFLEFPNESLRFCNEPYDLPERPFILDRSLTTIGRAPTTILPLALRTRAPLGVALIPTLSTLGFVYRLLWKTRNTPHPSALSTGTIQPSPSPELLELLVLLELLLIESSTPS
jgi:hypothetical protein